MIPLYDQDDKRRQVVAWLDERPGFVPEGWDSRQLAPLHAAAEAEEAPQTAGG